MAASKGARTTAAMKALAAKRAAKVPSYKKPMSALTPTQQKNRRRIQSDRAADKSPLYDYSQPLVGHVLKNTVASLANNTYNPQIATAKASNANVAKQYDTLAKNTRGYESDVARHDSDAQFKAAALSQILHGKQEKNATDAQATLKANADQDAAHAVKDDAVRGVSAAPSGEDGALSNRQAVQSEAQRTAGDQQSSNYEGLLNVMGQSRQLRGQETQRTQGIQRAGDIRAGEDDLKKLAAAKAGFTTDKTLQLRGEGYTNALAAKTLNLKDDALKAGVQNNIRNNRTSAANTQARITSQEAQTQARITSAENLAATRKATADAKSSSTSDDKYLTKFGMTKAQFLKLSPTARATLVASKSKTADKDKPTLTPFQAQKRVSTIKTAAAKAASYFKTGASPDEVKAVLLSQKGGGYDADTIQYAMWLSHKGGLNPGQLNALKRLGIDVSVFPKYKAPKKPAFGVSATANVGK